MKIKIFLSFLFLFLFVQNTFSQIDDILKKIPGVGDVFEEAVTTSIKDAYPTAYWLKDLDKQVNLTSGVEYSQNLSPGFYKFDFKTFCLHAGAYSPTEGAGYLVAPLKGAKSKLIKNVLSRYGEHPDIDQKDVQMLIWGIEANQKFSSYPADFQLRVAPLLTPEEIALMEVDTKEIAMELLPQDVKDVLNLYSSLRDKMSNPMSTFEDIEQIAVKTGIAPIGKGSKNIDAGVWTSIGGGVFIRCYPHGYRQTDVEVYVPSDVTIKRDDKNRIISLDDGTNKIEMTYDDSPGANALNGQYPVYRFKSVTVIGDETMSFNDKGWYIPSLSKVSGQYSRSDDPSLQEYNDRKKAGDDFIKSVKKSMPKKRRSKVTTSEWYNLAELKQLELSLKPLLGIDELNGSWYEADYRLAVDAVSSYISGLSGSKTGGSRNTSMDINGLVFAPANTSNQRLGIGNGGPSGGPPNPPPPPKKEKKDCNVSVTLHQVNESDLPKPDWVYTVTADISIEGGDEDCNAEQIVFTLYDVTNERGRYMNDKEQYDDVDPDLQMSDLNGDYQITQTTATKQISGKSQSQQVQIVCRDYGAYGKLKASVLVGGKWYEADGDGTPDKYITIPMDLNDNKISDFWEKQNNVYGKPAEWDEESNPKGQATNGDGMTIYEEYRGFLVSDGSGGQEYQRMDPTLKEIFVIDKDQIFDISSWKSASGIKAYWLTEDMVYGDKAGGDKNLSRWVDFCSGYAKGSKYAVRVVKMSGDFDPEKGSTTNVWGVNWGSGNGSPKANFIDEIFPDNITKDLYASADTLKKYIKKYPKGYIWHGQMVSYSTMKKFIDIMNDPVKSKYLIDYFLNATIIHEVGHACDVEHHGGGDTNKTDTGDLFCPMIYNGDFDYPIYLGKIMPVFNLIDKFGENVIVSYTKLKFCKKQDNCWKQLNVNDRL